MNEAMAIRFHRTGGPEVLALERMAVGDPGPGEARVRLAAAGLNFIDTYHRSGLYPVPALPSGLGLEGAGVVEAVGEGVSGVAVGDRVAFGTGPLGAYASVRVMPAAHLVRVPDAVDLLDAAGAMLKGMTAEYLLRRTYPVQAGDAILVHAAAGGVGLMLCQWAHHLGATVIGTVGSDAKAALARANGCDHPVVYTREDFVARVRALTEGRGVAVVYDGVGRDTLLRSLDCLRPRGLLASFGQASGPVPPLDVLELSRRGSLYLTRPSLMVYVATRPELEASAAALFAVIASGAVRVNRQAVRPLAEAAQAHRDLESRRTTGSVVLVP